MSHKFIHDSESKDSMYDYLEISLLRSVVVPDPLRKTVISAEVSRLFRILDMKSGSTVGGWTTDAVEVNCLLFLQPNVLPKSAKVPRLCVSAAFWDCWFLLLLLPGCEIPQSLNNSDSCASELRRRLEVVWEALDKSSADSMVVICAHELRRPTSLPRRPRIISCIKEMEKQRVISEVHTMYFRKKRNSIFLRRNYLSNIIWIGLSKKYFHGVFRKLSGMNEGGRSQRTHKELRRDKAASRLPFPSALVGNHRLHCCLAKSNLLDGFVWVNCKWNKWRKLQYSCKKSSVEKKENFFLKS